MTRYSMRREDASPILLALTAILTTLVAFGIPYWVPLSAGVLTLVYIAKRT
jgi:hypothetical protein